MIDEDPTGAKGYFWNNALLKRGVYFHPWHNMFINTAMTEGDIDHALQAADDAFKLLKGGRPAGARPVAKLRASSCTPKASGRLGGPGGSPMRGTGAFAGLVAWGLAIALGPSAHAQGARALRIDTTGQSLATALTDIARRSGRELLLAAPMVGGRPAPSLRGQYTIDQALTLLLTGSGLTYRRTADGTYIIHAAPVAPRERRSPRLPSPYPNCWLRDASPRTATSSGPRTTSKPTRCGAAATSSSPIRPT
jgi:hypothetical protein